ncbi:uncharacterized protein LODBEIA_P60710 [Lodderomyces beijingensis]|uniref:Uncharacterized protein n=1 Tax=Lodderomyces beijingensis TaxID=1775926 RepID=A0ABP0ZUP9_9ASCO
MFDLHHFLGLLADDKYLNESLLSEKEFIITSLPPFYLAAKLAVGKYKSSEVTTAFIKKHLIINTKTQVSAQLEQEIVEALAMARFLDCYFAATKTTIGPLHGLPIGNSQLEIVKRDYQVDDDALGVVKLNLAHYDLSGSFSGPSSPRLSPNTCTSPDASPLDVQC